MRKEQSAGAIIYRMQDERALFLVLHYSEGHWDFVKGKIEPGESKKQTAIREAMEEAGLDDIEFMEGFEQDIQYTYFRQGKGIPKEVTFFLAKTNKTEILLSGEHQDFRWLPYDKAMEKLTYENARDILLKANRFLVSL